MLTHRDDDIGGVIKSIRLHDRQGVPAGYKIHRTHRPREAASMAIGGGEVQVVGWWPSPYLMRPRIALNLKGVAYEFLEETYGGTKSELLLQSNPVYKRIPVLIHNGNPICESMIIVRYVDDVWANSGPAILPSDPYDRAIAAFWAVYNDDKWFPAITGTVMAHSEAAMAESAEKVLTGLRLLEEAFEKCSKGKGFFGGDTIGYLDIALGSNLAWLRAAEVRSGITLLDRGKTPLLVGWADRFCSDAAVKEVMPETGKLVEFAVDLLAKRRAAPPAE